MLIRVWSSIRYLEEFPLRGDVPAPVGEGAQAPTFHYCKSMVSFSSSAVTPKRHPVISGRDAAGCTDIEAFVK